ncbi:MAG: hypothetical protein A3I61_05060 [Acidobacteria bacterium RIFCSPLOWO2_02_FULL_68_18]|nr:MAG: hypothetical protein A3I61_05060 [Acidobacteria bacterium RIFCSPLOWO2_02_FULL_68_18]OFW51282.1 MAG: hypothetical protein A3G77_05500 [Acidobacteria bacterium RIFCSPLOWO2_12_FULL_68_19]
MPDAATRPTLLVVDDDPAICDMLERFGRRAGYTVTSRSGGRETLAHLGELRADVALVDLQMPEVDGLDVLRAIRAAQPDCQVILMTGYATVDTAIEAVKLGALDYLSKPLPLDRLKALLGAAREEIERRRALLEADRAVARRVELCGMIGRSQVMQELFALVRRLAPYARIALVTGETGTGKELVARALHQLGPRSRRPFVTVNCAAVVDSLFESELFGHVRGAFTGATDNKAGLFEAADGGTLFLDEVGELSQTVQAKLLRTLETGEVHRVGSLAPRTVDVRVVTATNRNLADDVADGRFRRDLLYRLNVVEIALPPLRDRREDIPYLTAAFLEEVRARLGVGMSGLTPAAETLLVRHAWPGNVRELRNVMERASLMAEGCLLTDRDIQRALPASGRAAGLPDVRREPGSVPVGHAEGGDSAERGPRSRLQDLERDQVQRALAEADGNKLKAAELLGISRRALYRKLEKYGLET